MSFPLETIDLPSPEPPGHRNPDTTTPMRPIQLSPSLSGEWASLAPPALGGLCWPPPRNTQTRASGQGGLGFGVTSSEPENLHLLPPPSPTHPALQATICSSPLRPLYAS